MPFADQLIGVDVAEQLASELHNAAPENPLSALQAATMALPPLSLRERSDALRDGLLADFPDGYWQLAAVIRSAAEKSETLAGWMIWPVTSALATRAASENTASSFQDAMDMLALLTPRLSSEFAMRILLKHDHEATLRSARNWIHSPDEHVRRLASEGTRPYLPWAIRVPRILEDPLCTIPILDALYRDPSDYVRRSVANHLNDLSRNEPELVVETAQRWLDAPESTTLAVVKRGLRTLVKRGNPEALALLGFGAPTVQIDGPHIAEPQVPWGADVVFAATICNTGGEALPLAIDYVLHHRKANGSTSAKVFKLATRTMLPGEKLSLNKSHSFRSITTRRYYPGTHSLALQVNGVPTGKTDFELMADSKE